MFNSRQSLLSRVARHGPVRTRTVNILLVAGALAAGLTVTACTATNATAGQGGSGGGPGAASPAGQGGSGGGSGAASPAGQAGEDPGCAALASQLPTINSQLSAASGNTSAELAVDEAWYNDLQADQQKAQSGVVAGAIGDTASGLEDVIVDEQNLLGDPSIGFSQLDSADSAFQSDVSNLETVCGISS